MEKTKKQVVDLDNTIYNVTEKIKTFKGTVYLATDKYGNKIEFSEKSIKNKQLTWI